MKSLLMAILLIFSLSLVYADTDGVWHEAEDIRGGIFASDEQGVTSDFTFINPVNFNDVATFTNSVIADNDADSSNIIAIDSGSSSAQYSGIDFSDRESAVWSVGKDNLNNFYIDQAGVDNRLSILSSNGNVGIGTLSPTSKLYVDGDVTSTTNFYVNSNVVWHAGNDGSASGLNADLLDGLDSSAFITSVTAGTGLLGGGTTGGVSLSADTSYLQRRVSASCPAGSSIRAISSTGTVTCETDDIGSSGVSGSGSTNYVPIFSSSSSLGNSVIYQSGSSIGVGATNPSQRLDVNGKVRARSPTVSSDSADVLTTKDYVDNIETGLDGDIDRVTANDNGYWTSSISNIGYVGNPQHELSSGEYFCGIRYKHNCDSTSSPDGCIEMKVCNINSNVGSYSCVGGGWSAPSVPQCSGNTAPSGSCTIGSSSSCHVVSYSSGDGFGINTYSTCSCS